MCQLLSESVMLAIVGGAIGLLLARWTVDLLLAFQPPLPMSMAVDLGIDLRVLVFTLLVSLMTGVAFGLAPALQASRVDLVSASKDEVTRKGTGSRRFGLRNLLVVAQVTVCLVLLIASGLFLRSLVNGTGDVLKLVVKQEMALVAIGVGLGLVGAMALTRVMQSVLYGITALDPVAFGATSLILVAVALLAVVVFGLAGPYLSHSP